MYANNNMIFKLEKLFKRVYYYRLLFKNYIYILFNLKNKNEFYVKLKDGTSGEITRDLLIDLVNLAQWGLISHKDISLKMENYIRKEILYMLHLEIEIYYFYL